MLFCDRCDRGYHTFCVGLSELPSGRWVCPKFCHSSGQRPRTGSAIRRSSVSDKALDKSALTAVADVVSSPVSVKPKVDRTVEAVAQAVLSRGGSIDASSVSLASYPDFSDLKSGSSLSNSPISTPEPRAVKRRRKSPSDIPCNRCGGPSGRKRRRGPSKLIFCANCRALVENAKKEVAAEDNSNSGSQ